MIIGLIVDFQCVFGVQALESEPIDPRLRRANPVISSDAEIRILFRTPLSPS
jgi:hypothetical protein